jgi:hypothetical protein
MSKNASTPPDDFDPLETLLKGLSLEEIRKMYLVPPPLTEVDPSLAEVDEPNTIPIKTEYGELTFTFDLEHLAITVFSDLVEMINLPMQDNIEAMANKYKLSREKATALYFHFLKKDMCKLSLHATRSFIDNFPVRLHTAILDHALYVEVRTFNEVETNYLSGLANPSELIKKAVKITAKMARQDMNAPGRGRQSDWSKWESDKVRRAVQEAILSLPESLLPTQEKVVQKINKKYHLSPPLTSAALGKTFRKFRLSWKELRKRKK